MFLANWSWISKKVALVDDLGDQFLDVIGLVRVVGDQRVERQLHPVGRIAGRQHGHAGLVVERQEVHQTPHLQQCFEVVLVGAVGDRGAGGVDLGAAQFFRRHGLVGDGFHHVRAGDEHVARVLHHEDEVGHRRRVHVAARARAHDHADLWNDAGRQRIAQEHLAIAAERRDALLDARAAGIEQADDWAPVLQRHVLDLCDLPGVRFRQRTAEHGEILGEHVGRAAVDRAPAGDDAIARDLVFLHAEVGRAVLDEHVELLERAVVEQQFDPFAGGELALLVLGVDAGLAATEARHVAPALEFRDDVFHVPARARAPPNAALLPQASHSTRHGTRKSAVSRVNNKCQRWPAKHYSGPLVLTSPGTSACAFP